MLKQLFRDINIDWKNVNISPIIVSLEPKVKFSSTSYKAIPFVNKLAIVDKDT